MNLLNQNGTFQSMYYIFLKIKKKKKKFFTLIIILIIYLLNIIILLIIELKLIAICFVQKLLIN